MLRSARSRRSIRWILSLLTAAVLAAGCGTVRPASKIVPTTWPEPSSAATPTVTASAPAPSASTPTPGASTAAAPVWASGVTTHDGMSAPIPAGFTDQTAGPEQPAGSAPANLGRRVLQLGDGRRVITVRSIVMDQPDLAHYVPALVADLQRDKAWKVTGQAMASVAGATGTELTLVPVTAQAAPTTGRTLVYVGVPSPGNAVVVLGQAPDERARAEIALVAQGLRIS